MIEKLISVIVVSGETIRGEKKCCQKQNGNNDVLQLMR